MLIKIFKVARRDFIETVKTKIFLFGVLLVPLLVGGSIFLFCQDAAEKVSPAPRPDRKVTVVNPFAGNQRRHRQRFFQSITSTMLKGR